MEGIQFPSNFPYSCPQCSHSGQFNQVLLPTFINDVGSNPSLMSWKNMGVIVRYTYNVAPPVISWFMKPINYSYKYHKP